MTISPDQLRLILAQAKAGLAMQPDMPIQLRCDVVVKLIEAIPTSAPESELDELRYDLIKRLRYWSDEHGRTDCGAAADQIYMLGVQCKERAELAQKWHALVQGLAVMLGMNSAGSLDQLSKGISEAIQHLQSNAVLVEHLRHEMAWAQANEMQDRKDMIRVNMERDALASQVAQLRDELTAANLQRDESRRKLCELADAALNTLEAHPETECCAVTRARALAALATPSAQMKQEETRAYRAKDCVCEHPFDLTIPGSHHHRSCPLRDPRSDLTPPVEPAASIATRSTTKHQPSAFDQTSPPLWDSTSAVPMVEPKHIPCVWRTGCRHPDVCQKERCCVPQYADSDEDPAPPHGDKGDL
jgi:hypothetical protein